MVPRHRESETKPPHEGAHAMTDKAREDVQAFQKKIGMLAKRSGG